MYIPLDLGLFENLCEEQFLNLIFHGELREAVVLNPILLRPVLIFPCLPADIAYADDHCRLRAVID